LIVDIQSHGSTIATNAAPAGMSEAPTPPIEAPSMVVAANLKVNVPKTLLANEADVDEYVEDMKKTMLAEIRAGKKVIV
jgi:hypothetical protein